MVMVKKVKTRSRNVETKQRAHRVVQKSLLSAILCGVICGCNVGDKGIDSDLAIQVAVDASGVDASQVQNMNVQEADGIYQVRFDSWSGTYQIGVHPNGEVAGYSYQAFDNPVVPEEAQPEELVLPEGSLSKEELIQIAARMVQAINYTDDDFWFEVVDDNTVRISMNSDNGKTYTAVVDPRTGTGTVEVSNQ